MRSVQVLLFFALIVGLTAAAEKHLLPSRQRRLPDVFVSSAKKGDYTKDVDDHYYNYYYYYPEGIAKKPEDYNYKGKGKGGKGGKGKGSPYEYDYEYDYDDEYHDVDTTHRPTPAPKSSKSSKIPIPYPPPKIPIPHPPPKTDPPHGYHFHEPPRDRSGKGMKKGKGSSFKYDYGKKPTPAPYSRPPIYIPPVVPSPPTAPTRVPTPVFPPVTPPNPPPIVPTPPGPQPTRAPSPTPPVPVPSMRPTLAPVGPGPGPGPGPAPTPTPAPVAPPSGGPQRVDLTPFSIEYDIAPIMIPPTTDIEAVAALTASFLQNLFQQFRGNPSDSFVMQFVGEDLDFPTYTIDYEAFAIVSDGKTQAELDEFVSSAFRGANLQTYIQLLQTDLPPENAFSRVEGVRKVETSDGRNADPVPAPQSSNAQLPIPLLAAAGAASFALIILGLSLNRREKAAIRKGKGDKYSAAEVRTVAGDTFAGETFAETTCSTSKLGKDHYSTDSSNPEYESAVHHFLEASSNGSHDSYGTDSDDDYEEAKTEIEEDYRSLSAASFSQYGGVVPVDEVVSPIDVNNPDYLTDPESHLVVNSAYLARNKSNNLQEEDEEHASMHSDIRSGGDSPSTVQGSASSGETSIHILEATSSDDEDLKKAIETQQALEAYYSNGTQMQVPSVEQPDYEDEDLQEVQLDSDFGRRNSASSSSKRSERSVTRESRGISSQQGVDSLQRSQEDDAEHQGGAQSERKDGSSRAARVSDLIQRYN